MFAVAPANIPHRHARGERRHLGRARLSITHTRPPSSLATRRRSSPNAPQRAGTRRDEGGDAQAGMKRESSVPASRTPAANERDRERTVVDDLPPDAKGTPRGGTWAALLELRWPRMDERSASIAGNDAPRINERAATRGRSATEGGDERAGVKGASSVRAPAWGTFTANDATRGAHARRCPAARRGRARQVAAGRPAASHCRGFSGPKNEFVLV
jgi:hypothetical protein